MLKLLRLASIFLAAGSVTLATAGNTEAKKTFAEKSTATQSAEYPLTTCVVSEDKLEDADMGPPIDYIHQEAGRPDRVVRLCCKACVRDFKKDPARYLKLIDDAAAMPSPTAGG